MIDEDNKIRCTFFLNCKTTERENNGGVHELQISTFCGVRIAIKSTSPSKINAIKSTSHLFVFFVFFCFGSNGHI